MRRVFEFLFVVSFLLCGSVGADEKNGKNVPASVKVTKGRKGDILTITGRITSRHVRFRKGRSVRTYLIVTRDLKKIPLPRSHVEHRDGTISGIYLREFRGKTVQIVCEGRIKDDPKKGEIVTVSKIVSLKVPGRSK